MITSSSNPIIKRIRRLRQKKYRRQEGAFFVEGLRVFLAAVETDQPIQRIIYSPELLSSDLGLNVLAEQRDSGVDCSEVSAQVFGSISSREHPVGLGAVVSSRWSPLDQLAIRSDSVYTGLVNVSEPGNLGTIIRTIDATGGDGLILVGRSVDPFHPTAVKASMGAVFSITVSQVDKPGDLWNWAKEHQLGTVATSAHESQAIWDCEFTLPLLLLFGNEGEGLPGDVLRQADQAVAIPMRGSASSLNLAIAAGLILYEVLRKQVS
jgi:TrmH family RNA methyltransferase